MSIPQYQDYHQQNATKWWQQNITFWIHYEYTVCLPQVLSEAFSRFVKLETYKLVVLAFGTSWRDVGFLLYVQALLL